MLRTSTHTQTPTRRNNGHLDAEPHADSGTPARVERERNNAHSEISLDRKFAILGQGTALPEYSIDLDESLAYAHEYFCQTDDQVRRLRALYRMAGVKNRHTVVLGGPTDSPDRQSFLTPPKNQSDCGPSIRTRMAKYETEALPLALKAARQALGDAGTFPSDISHLITVSCSGFSAPGVDIGLMKNLPLSNTVQRTHIGFMGCHGALNGLRVARAITESDRSARVLLCAVELCSLHYHYGWNNEQLVANALFADGAAAIVGGAHTGESDDTWRIDATGSCLIPDSEDAMTWRIGDNGFEMSLSARVPELIGTHLKDWFEQWLGEQDLTTNDIKSWAVHPGGPRILSSVTKALGLEREAVAISREVLRDHGNMSSPTLLFILKKLRERKAQRPCVALGFGPGLMAEATLFV